MAYHCKGSVPKHSGTLPLISLDCPLKTIIPVLKNLWFVLYLCIAKKPPQVFHYFSSSSLVDKPFKNESSWHSHELHR